MDEAVSLQSTAPKAFGEPGSAPSSVENSVIEMSPSLFRRVVGSEEPWFDDPRVAATLLLSASTCSKGTTWVSEADFLRDPLVPLLSGVTCTCHSFQIGRSLLPGCNASDAYWRH